MHRNKKYRILHHKKYGYSPEANQRVGGLRKQVLERDGFKCVGCGLTDEEHKNKHGFPITIDHKDKNRKNNTMGNLQTLCIPCHGKKDHPKTNKFHPFIEEAILMRKNGMSYMKIAKYYKISHSTARKYLSSVEVLDGKQPTRWNQPL